MNRTKFKSEVSAAIKDVADKHGVDVKLTKIEKADDHMESVLTITQAKQVTPTVDSTSTRVKGKSRLDQVKALISKGIKSPSQIAAKLDTNASYVSRLIKQANELVVA